MAPARPEVLVPLFSQEMAESQRSVPWIVGRGVATTCRAVRDHVGRFILLLALRAAILAAVFSLSRVVAAAVLLAMVLRAQLPVIRKLWRGRIWEVRSGDPGGRSRVCGWAIVSPHPLDRDTWQLDLVPHPLRSSHGWAHVLLPEVHRAADLYGAALQAVDLTDTPILVQFGYHWAGTPIDRRHFLLRPVTDAVPADAGSRPEGPEPLWTAYQTLVARPDDTAALTRLADCVLAQAAPIQADVERWGWNAYVLRRTAPAWVLARSCALCLDSYIESLASGRIGLPGSTDERSAHDRRLREVSECLLATTELLRVAIEGSTTAHERAGGQSLSWARRLATVEVDALALAGLTATGRHRSGVTLGLLDTQSSDLVRQAALRVRTIARSVRRSTWFDAEALTSWASAIAYDALELSRYRFAAIGLRRAINRVAASNMRQLTFIPAGSGESDQQGVSENIEVTWRTLLNAAEGPPKPTSRLAPLSATRIERIGAVRGAEGLRVKQFRRMLAELITNFALIVVIGVLAWVLTLFAIHPIARARGLLDYFGDVISGEHVPPPDTTVPLNGGFDLGINSELVRDGTIGLLAVVITAAVAVAVAIPRESSIKAWSQDRAWQVFVVAVSYVASTAAIVLAISPLPLWAELDPGQKAHVTAALIFALLSAAAAASMSAMQSRLDEWQQRRRLLLSEARLDRAHARLGPSPTPLRLVLDGLVCVVQCIAWVYVPLILINLLTATLTLGDAFWTLVGLTIIDLPPMAAITTLFVVRWVSAWSLAGRVAVTIAVLAAFALVLMAAPIGVWLAADLSDVGFVVVLAMVTLIPIFLYVILLAAARVKSFQIQRATGPGTFALHVALRLGRRNFRRAAE